MRVVFFNESLSTICILFLKKGYWTAHESQEIGRLKISCTRICPFNYNFEMTITVILNVILTVQHFRFSKVSRGSRMTLSMHGHLKEAQESRQRERNEHFFVKIKMNFVIVVDACYCCWCWRRTFEFIPCRSTSPVHSPRAHGPKALFGAFRSSC